MWLFVTIIYIFNQGLPSSSILVISSIKYTDYIYQKWIYIFSDLQMETKLWFKGITSK